MKQLIIVLIPLLLSSTSLGQEKVKSERLVCSKDQPCSCFSLDNNNTWTIDCSNSNLNTTFVAPLDDTLEYTNISFENSQLTVLKKDEWPKAHMDHIQTLNLANNKIFDIEKDTFSRLTNLKVLNLTKNKLDSIDMDWFAGLTMLLEHLDLSDNKITTIPDNAFKKLTTLQYLHLDGNRITRISSQTFFGLGFLLDLNLDRNPISMIDDDAFQPMSTRLTTLSMVNNKLDQLPNFKNLPVLNKFIFGRNDILKSISYRTFDGAPNITDICFDFMGKLANIDDCAFCGLPKLSVLRISGSPNVKTITKANFDPEFFNRPMDTIDFSNNSLTTLSSKMVNWKSVGSIYLAGNKWNCTCNVLWMTDNNVNFLDVQKCYTPANLRGSVIKNVPKSSFGDCKIIIAYQTPKIFIAMTMILLISGTVLIAWYIWSSRKHEGGISNIFKTNPLSKQPYAYRNLAMNQEDTEHVIPNRHVDEEEDDAPYPAFDKDNSTKASLV